MSRNLDSLLLGGLQMVSSSKCRPLGGGAEGERKLGERPKGHDYVFLEGKQALFPGPAPRPAREEPGLLTWRMKTIRSNYSEFC